MAGCGIAALLLLATGAGCQRGAASADAPKKSTPQESLESVLTTFRRGMETGAGSIVASSGSLAHQDGGVSVYTIENQVSHEYLPAEQADGEHRAKITVESRSRFSIKPAQGNKDSRDDTSEKSAREGAGTASGAAGAGVGGGLSSGGGSRSTSRGVGGEVPEAHKNTEIRTYELAYRNGRWELVTAIDPETDKAALEAFKYAIQTQL
jgi:hypothetical protein